MNKRASVIKVPERSRRASAQFMTPADDSIKPFLRLLIPRVAALLGAKSRGVIVAPAFDDARSVFDVQHLVEEDVFNEPFRNFRRIQHLADGNGVVCAVVVAENAARAPSRPRQRGHLQRIIEMLSIQSSE